MTQFFRQRGGDDDRVLVALLFHEALIMRTMELAA